MFSHQQSRDSLSRSPDPSGTPEPAGGGRLLGVDLARAVALVGMMVTHIFPLEDPEPTWAVIFAGRASALFAVLAGVSVVLSTRGLLRTPGLRAWAAAASGLWVRGFVIFFLGLTLGLIGTPVAVILANYGIMFVIAAFLLRLPRWSLAVLTPLWMLGTPLLSHAVRTTAGLMPSYQVPDLTMLTAPGWLLEDLVLTGYYPVLQWTGYLLLGMLLARLNWSSGSLWAGLAFLGATIAALAQFCSSLLLTMGGRAVLESELSAGADPLGSSLEDLVWVGSYGTTPTGSWWWMALAGPHASTPLDLLHAGGVAVAVLAVCVLTARGCAVRWLSPAIAAGAMPLSIYTAHVLFVGLTDELFGSVAEFAVHVGGALLFAWLWRRFVGPRGPLEWPLSRLVVATRGLFEADAAHQR